MLVSCHSCATSSCQLLKALSLSGLYDDDGAGYTAVAFLFLVPHPSQSATLPANSALNAHAA